MKFFSILFFLFSFTFLSQSKSSEVIQKTEDFILSQQKDSITSYTKKLGNSLYESQLKDLINSDFKTLELNKIFLNKVSTRYVNNYLKVSKYINDNIKTAKGSQINLDYVEIKWNQVVYLLRDQYLEESNKVLKSLETYVNLFENNNTDVKKARLRLKTQDLQIKIIKNEIEIGKKLAYQCIAEAKALNDLELEVIFTMRLLAFFVSEKNVDSYIKTSEKILEKASELENKNYYFEILSRLVNAYIYKGGYEEKYFDLLDDLYENKQTKGTTLIYFVQIIHTNINDKELVNKVLNKFNANSISDFINIIKPLSKKELVDIDYLAFLDQASMALFFNKDYDMAFKLKNESLALSKEIYTNKLSNTLAEYKTEQAVKVKESEIKSQKEKNVIYLGIASLIGVFLILSLFIIRKIKKQSQELSAKNSLISKTLKEKELLVKEIHHRVKNNFQIVSSLLELQTKGIEDEKALELATEGKNRVKSMALIHQKLYQNEQGLINFDEYINQLVKELSMIYNLNQDVKTQINSKGIKFDVDTAIPLGLIINEIITNSYKYAFNKTKENNLSVSITKEKENNYKLVIQDDGPGLSKDFDIKKTKSLGLRLVNRLVKQLHGKLKQTNTIGAKFEIYFKDTNARQLVN